MSARYGDAADEMARTNVDFLQTFCLPGEVCQLLHSMPPLTIEVFQPSRPLTGVPSSKSTTFSNIDHFLTIKILVEKKSDG